MKKIIQISAFVLAALITFTSATIVRDTLIYGVQRTGTTPPPPTSCKLAIYVRSGVGEQTNLWVLHNTQLGRPVQPSDLGDLTIDEYIEQNQEYLLCVALNLIIE